MVPALCCQLTADTKLGIREQQQLLEPSVHKASDLLSPPISGLHALNLPLVPQMNQQVPVPRVPCSTSLGEAERLMHSIK